jgi:prepilin-type N-terminal cleavage/methylation domain-containing protein
MVTAVRARTRVARGFTVIEAMVVVFIIAILAAAAAPSMNQLIRTQKVRGTAYDLFADLTYARSEAISRGHNVGIGSNAGNNWANGWRVQDLATGAVLRQQGKLSSGITFTADSAGLIFASTGRNTTGNVTFAIAPVEADAPDNQKRCIRITPSGRPNSINGPCP